jgi:hypothetical protein
VDGWKETYAMRRRTNESVIVVDRNESEGRTMPYLFSFAGGGDGDGDDDDWSITFTFVDDKCPTKRM